MSSTLADRAALIEHRGMHDPASEFHDLPPIPGRDPEQMLEHILATRPLGDLWVFGYGSLIWNPEVLHTEVRAARLWGWHRALRMWSRINRGTPERPGLVFALISGGSCTGVALRVPQAQAQAQLRQLWRREMPRAVYDPRWLRCLTPAGPVSALAFTLSRRSPSYTGELDDATLVAILRDSAGRYGTTLDYVLRTAQALASLGIRDREVERVLRLAARAGLV